MLVVEALLAGFAIGAIVGLLGAGGGILSVPVLIYLLHQSPHNAAAGSLVIVGLTALVSLVPQVKSGKIQWRDGLIFGILSIFGSVAGSRISLLINEILLLVLFGVLLAGVAVMMLHKAITIRRDENLLANTEKANTEEQPTKESEKSPQARNLFALIAAATCTGFLTGFLASEEDSS
ncbi:sulfite exporter TauE/SafE family protein [Arcanobacterium hippocoleae]|uniref:sulfite exporter TauE/SafE family protein n=1 Tax=Arcanobacterium hippocoleae TaxID=149017 RepID=UPI003340F3E9